MASPIGESPPHGGDFHTDPLQDDVVEDETDVVEDDDQEGATVEDVIEVVADETVTEAEREPEMEEGRPEEIVEVVTDETAVEAEPEPEVEVEPETELEVEREPDSLDVVEEEERVEIVVEPDAVDMGEEEVPSLTPGFVFIPAGSFSMGSPIGEPGQSTNEAQHTVTLTVSFEMMAREVTQGDFLARVGRNPSYFPSCGATCPVEQVSWHEALDYANLFSAYMGKAQCFDCTGSGTAGVTCSLKTAYARPQDCPGYRLPTEAEWEYAARATTTSAYHDGGASDSGHLHCETPFHLTDIAWYCGNASSTTHAVGGKTANPWGLFDMSGNVWEWVWDWHRADYEALSATDPVNMTAGSNRVVRGGSWYYYAHYCRSAYRSNNSPGIRSGALGLRLARSW